MTDTNIENIKSKIRKLLALHNDNTSDAESYAALAKAQELMAQYKLETQDIENTDKKQECIRKKTILSYGSRSSDEYLIDLADLIADNFCCVSYITTTRGTQTHYISFMGLEEDVEIATEILYVANRFIVQGYNRVYKELSKEYGSSYVPARYFNPAKIGYIKGYISGLKIALEDQKKKNQEWGLVLVVPQEAKEFIGSIGAADYTSAYHRTDHSFYQRGFNDGVEFHLNDKIGSRESAGSITE